MLHIQPHFPGTQASCTYTVYWDGASSSDASVGGLVAGGLVVGSLVLGSSSEESERSAGATGFLSHDRISGGQTG